MAGIYQLVSRLTSTGRLRARVGVSQDLDVSVGYI